MFSDGTGQIYFAFVPTASESGGAAVFFRHQLFDCDIKMPRPSREAVASGIDRRLQRIFVLVSENWCRCITIECGICESEKRDVES